MKYGVLSYLPVNENVLMLKKSERKEDPNSGFYALPGGKLEPYEKNCKEGRLSAAVRETREETGLTLIKPKLIGTILFDNFEREFKEWKKHDNYHVSIFYANEYSGTLLDETEEGKPLWVQRKDIPSLRMNSGDKKMYEWIFDGRSFSGVIYHKGKELDLEKTWVDFF
ncbi:MAG: NUDIX domain-containing protein [archaeon]|nr:NUDIX domain-containing protein [archaeon]